MLNDESGLGEMSVVIMDQHYTIKISALNNIKHIGHSIKLKSESIQMKFSSSLPLFSERGLFR
jgi:hypothetical protein